MTLRNWLAGIVLLGLVPAACSDSDSSGDNGNEAGADNGGEGGTSGASPTGGRSTGGNGGTAGESGSDSGGTSGSAGEGGEPTGGTGAEGGSDEGGMGGEPGTGGGGMAGRGMAGGATAGGGAGGATAGGGVGGAMAGGGVGGAMAGGGVAMAGGGGVGGATAGGGVGGAMAGGGSGGVGREANCSDGQDNDGDAAVDCADSDCALVCSLGTCPAGTSPTVYTATGLPLAIPDNMSIENPAFAPITITTAGLVGKIAVEASITHTWDGDLDISLVTPYGVRLLSDAIGYNGDNFTRTVFSDSAADSITVGTAPFTGTFRPLQDLGAVNGVTLAGTYGLRVGDGASLDVGELTSFSLAFCQCLANSGSCEFGPYACENGVDDDGDGLVDCQESVCASSPSCPPVEHACGDGVDNDANGSVNCADPACSWACTALGSECTGANRLFTYSTRNVPQTIDPAGGTFPAPIFALTRGTVVSSAFRFNAAHTFAADLTLYATSPSGTTRALTGRNGGDGDNYTNTVFLDSATTSVVGATAPFTGTYQPQELMSVWNSQAAFGYWYGELWDWTATEGGTFTELSLGLCVAP